MQNKTFAKNVLEPSTIPAVGLGRTNVVKWRNA